MTTGEACAQPCPTATCSPCLTADSRREILTGGGDGYVKFWQISAAGGLGSCTRSVALVQNGIDGPVPAPMVRAAAVSDASGSLVVGTAACDIWKVDPDDTARMVLFGHHGHVVGLATNPNLDYAHVFATCSNSNKVALWSMATNKVCAALVWPCLTCAQASRQCSDPAVLALTMAECGTCQEMAVACFTKSRNEPAMCSSCRAQRAGLSICCADNQGCSCG